MWAARRFVWFSTNKIVVACVLLSRSRVLQLEVRKGYAQHYFLALGHMAEAEDELQDQYPALSDKVREARKAWEQDPAAVPDFHALVVAISKATGYDLDAWFDETKEKP